MQVLQSCRRLVRQSAPPRHACGSSGMRKTAAQMMQPMAQPRRTPVQMALLLLLLALPRALQCLTMLARAETAAVAQQKRWSARSWRPLQRQQVCEKALRTKLALSLSMISISCLQPAELHLTRNTKPVHAYQ